MKQFLFFKGTAIAAFHPDEMDPPFGSGHVDLIPADNTIISGAQEYLQFTIKEFELSDTSKAYTQFEKALECDYADWYLSTEWSIGEKAEGAYSILQPMMSREGYLVFTVGEGGY